MTQLGDILTGAGMVAAGAGVAASERDPFGGSTVTIAGVLAILAAQEADRAVATRVADIDAMRALLGDAAPPTPAGLTLTEVEAAWDAHAAALIEAHATAEAAGDGAADAAILAFFREHAARRELVWPM